MYEKMQYGEFTKVYEGEIERQGETGRCFR